MNINTSKLHGNTHKITLTLIILVRTHLDFLGVTWKHTQNNINTYYSCADAS